MLRYSGLVLLLLVLGLDEGVCHSAMHEHVEPVPTVVYTCSSHFIQFMNNRVNVTADPGLGGLARMVYGFIDGLCRNDTGYGRNFVACLFTNLAYSSYPIDKILTQALNQSALSDILKGGCSSLAEMKLKLECIISAVMANPAAVRCMTDIKYFFQSIISSHTAQISSGHVVTFCSTWGNMIECIAPYIAVCSESLNTKWLEYGSHILSPSCKKTAFAKSKEDITIEDTSVDIHKLLNGNNSAVVSCAREFSQEMLQFMPTSVFNHSVHPSEVIIAFNSVCDEQIQTFMYCLDERRLNMTSQTDEFLFQVISTVNMRVAYNQLCSKLDVLKANINCLLTSADEIKQCMCFMNDLVRKVHMVSTMKAGFSYDKIVEPFCGSYVSFVECYVDLVSTCSVDLGQVMNNVYLGVLTTQCLSADRTACPGVMPTGGSAFLQCGEKVAEYVASKSKNATNAVKMEYKNMIQHMEDLIIGTYAYTCSIGPEILTCMVQNMLPSQNSFDILVKQMFDVSKFRSLLSEGCNLSLIKDLQSRMKFFLSTLMSDPDTTPCIEALNKFSQVLKDNVNMDEPDAAEPFCRIWADFSECIESQLACSSPQLVDKWRTFTIDSMTEFCYNVAVSQQQTNQYLPTCTIHEISDSAMSMCGLEYMIPYQKRDDQRDPILDQVDMVIMEEINHFCQYDAAIGMSMIQCLRSIVPASFLLLDRAVSSTFDFNVLETILKKACALRPALKGELACIVDTIQMKDAGDKCIYSLVDSFNVSGIQDRQISKVVERTCGAWIQFVLCIDPLIDSCDHRISHAWKDLSFELLTSKCSKQLALTDKSDSGGQHCMVSMATVLLNIFTIVLCIKRAL